MEANPATTRAATTASVQRVWSICLLMLGAWLGAAAWLVNVEYGDGYSTVANAKYFAGSSDAWFWQRGPMLALLLAPAEWLARYLALGPLDVRMHHAQMALLHLGYLAGCWSLLRKVHGPTPAALAAWLAAIPTTVFFSYAPFLSHDIAPGLLVLYLLWLAHAHGTSPTATRALLFGAVSMALLLTKQTYAVAPPAVLLARLAALASTGQLDRNQWRAGLTLAAMAVVAGAASWLVYGYLMAQRFPELPLLLRPLSAIHEIANNYEGQRELSDLFDRWVYLRNLPAYGMVAALLLLPSLALAWFGRSVWGRQLALTWLVLLVALLWTPFREVRYLAFLAPLTAALLVPAIDAALLRAGRFRAWLALPLLLDLGRAMPEAARVFHPYYREGVTAFFEPLAAEKGTANPIFFGIGWLNFISPDRHAFAGDPFHRITEMQIDQVRVLHGLSRERMFRIRLAVLAQAAKLQAGSLFLVQNHLLTRERQPVHYSRASLPENYSQFLARATDLGFSLRDGAYVADVSPGTPVLLLRTQGEGSELLRIEDRVVEVERLRRFGSFQGTPERLVLRALVVLRDCTLDGCRRTSD